MPTEKLIGTEVAYHGKQGAGYFSATQPGKAGIEYSKEIAQSENLTGCEFIQWNASDIEIPGQFDLAMIIFGAIANLTSDEASRLIAKLSDSVKPSGQLIIELCCVRTLYDFGSATCKQ